MRLNIFFPDEWMVEWDVDVPDDSKNADVTKQFGGKEKVSAVYKLEAGAVRLTDDEIDDPQLERLIHRRLQSVEMASTLSRVRTVESVFSGYSKHDLHLVIRTKKRTFNIYRFDTEEAYHAVVEYEPSQKDMIKLLPVGVGQKQARLLLVPYDTPCESGTPDEIGLNLEKLQSVKFTKSIDECFKWGLQADMLHVVLHVTTPSESTLKRKAPEPDINELICASKLAKVTPSDFSKSNVYRQFQANADTKILDNRPTPDKIPPLAMLYPGFSRFVARADGRDSSFVVEETMKKRVDSLAENMSATFTEEKDRKEAAWRGLGHIFSSDENRPVKPREDIPSSNKKSDGHLLGPHGLPILIVETKEETGNANTAAAQAAGCVAQHAKSDVLARPLDSLARQWKVPCLVMAIIASQITFYGLVLLGDRMRSLPLTPSLSCVHDACEGSDRERLYRAISAAVELIKEIRKDAELVKAANLPPIPPKCCKTPGVFRLSRYKKQNEWLYFQIVDILHDSQPDRQVYIAETPAKERIVIKYTQRYSIQVHDFCAEKKMAPEILAYEELPRGWLVIAMHHVVEAKYITQSSHCLTHSDVWKQELRKLVDDIKAEGLVHGDLRAANILVSEKNPDKALVVDFDWGGKAGVVKYPDGCEMNRELWRDEVDPCGSEITTADDTRVLEQTFAQLPKKDA